MSTITESTKAKIRAAIKADPTRGKTSGGNENGPREIQIDGHEIAIAWDPIDQTWAAWEQIGNAQTGGSCEEIQI